MRKILCLFMSLIILIIPVYAEELTVLPEELELMSAGNSDSLIFDADLSEYTVSSTVIKDKSATGATVEVISTPALKTETINDNDIKYLDFNTGVVTNFKSNDASLLGLDDMTVEIWAKPSVTDDNGRVLFSLSKTNKKTASFYAEMTTEAMTVCLNGQSAQCSITDYMDNWTHFVFTRSYDAENKTASLKVFADSEEVISETFEDILKEDESEKSFFVGAPGSSALQLNYVFMGGVSEARVYNVSFDSTNAKVNYLTQSSAYRVKEQLPEEEPENPTGPKEEGLLFELEIGDSVSDLKDSSGNEISVVTGGNVGISTYKGLGGDTQYVAFDGSSANAYIELSDERLLNNTDTTVELRMIMPEFKASSYPKYFSIGTGGSSSAKSLWAECGSDNEGYIMLANSNLGNIRTNGVGIYDSQWVHIVITRSYSELTKSATLELFLNGKSLGAKSFSNMETPGDNPAAKVYAGGASYNGGLDRYTGGISEYRIYNKMLDGEEIKAKYENGLEKYTTLPFVVSDGVYVERTASMANIKMIGGLEPVSDISVTEALTKNPFAAMISQTDIGFDISFLQYLRYGLKLRLYSPSLDTYSYIEVEKGTTDVNADIYDENDIKVKKLNGSDLYSVNLNVKNTGTHSKEYKYSVIAKTSSKASVAIKSGVFAIDGGESDSEFFVLEGTKDATEIRIYVWESISGMLIPIYESPTVIK